MVHAFHAKYPQPCWVCGEYIERGELIASNRAPRAETFYGHPDCIEASENSAKKSAIRLDKPPRRSARIRTRRSAVGSFIGGTSKGRVEPDGGPERSAGYGDAEAMNRVGWKPQ